MRRIIIIKSKNAEKIRKLRKLYYSFRVLRKTNPRKKINQQQQLRDQRPRDLPLPPLSLLTYNPPLLIPRGKFLNVVKDIALSIDPDVKFTPEAVQQLQRATENYIVDRSKAIDQIMQEQPRPIDQIMQEQPRNSIAAEPRSIDQIVVHEHATVFEDSFKWRVDELVNERVNKRINERANRRVNKLINERINEQLNKRLNEQRLNARRELAATRGTIQHATNNPEARVVNQ